MNFALLISLFYVLIGIRVCRETWKDRVQIFDHNFTAQDRYMVSQTAFFVIIPISVALHELGHAIAVWSFGGTVVDFGFYFFAGYVSYAEPFSPLQHLVVAAAGSLVNLLIVIVLLSFVLFKPTPMRPAFADLLITGAVLQAANAFIFYPLLDFATNIEGGDWQQMYSGDAGNWRWVVLAVHASILVAGFGFTRVPALRKRLNERTGMPAGVDRGLMGGGAFAPARNRHAKPQQVVAPGNTRIGTSPPVSEKRFTVVEERMMAAAGRVSSGWGGTVQHRLRSTPSASEVLMIWSDGVNGVMRVAVLRAIPDGSGELWGVLFSDRGQTPPADRRRIRRWDILPDENELTMALRVGMEQIGRWPLKDRDLANS